MVQGHKRQHESRDERNRRAAEERQIAGAINSLHRDYNAAQKNRAQEDSEHLKWSRRTAITAVIYTVVTACVLGASVFSIIQAWKAIDAASRAADAATRQEGIAEDTEIRQLRPYLHVIPGDSEWSFKPDGTVQVTAKPSIKVVGQTPAGQVAPAWKLKVDEFPITDNFTFDTLAGGTSTAVVFPGEPAVIEKQKIAISKEDAESINRGAKRIYIEGTVVYIDSFAHLGKTRWSNFCFYADMKGATDGWQACTIHNGADWDPRKPSSTIIPMSQ